MGSDDFTAFTAISMGALASAAMTFALMPADPDPVDETDAVSTVVVAEPVRSSDACPSPRPIIDFAIIRSKDNRTELLRMVGPEGRASGWEPESLEMRLLRSR